MTSSSATRLLLAVLPRVCSSLHRVRPRRKRRTTCSTAPTLQRVDLELHIADWSKLKENFQTNTFYPADFKWNGQTVLNVGIRSRGRGSRNANKPGLKIDFDKYSTNQKFLGLKSLVLDNLTQDPSGIHETVSMEFYARLGIPAPRETHVRLYVRGEYIGLYALVEAVDKEILARIYGSIGEDTQNDGWLYEFAWQEDWRFTDLGTDLERDQAALRCDDARIEDGRGEVPQGAGADHARQPDAGGAIRRRARAALRHPRVHPLRRRAGVPRRHRRIPRRVRDEQLLSVSPREPGQARADRVGHRQHVLGPTFPDRRRTTPTC